MNLSLRLHNNDYYPILIEYLDIAKESDSFETLRGIDSFLARFTTEEILDSIVRSNILNQDAVYNSSIVITYKDNDKIRELEAHTLSDTDYIDFEVMAYIFKIFNNKNRLNQINNYFTTKKYIPKDLKEFAEVLNNDTVLQVIDKFDEMCYGSQRLVKDYVYNKIYSKTSEAIRKKEKLS